MPSLWPYDDAPRASVTTSGGTFDKSGPSPSAIVRCARTASRSLGYGSSASIAACTPATTSPAPGPSMVKPRNRSLLPATSALMKPRRAPHRDEDVAALDPLLPGRRAHCERHVLSGSAVHAERLGRHETFDAFAAEKPLHLVRNVPILLAEKL